MERLVSKYLTDINIPISRKYCEKLIASHPDYPSMLSIADTLQRLGLRYKAARIEQEQLHNLEYPYLLWPEEHGREPRIIRDEQDLPGNGAQDPDNTETGNPTIVLKAEPIDTISDEENNRQRSQDRFVKLLSGVLVATVTGLILLNVLPPLAWVYTSLLLTALAGAVVGYLLIAKEVGINYEPVEAFCRGGKKTNCDALLSSEAAQLFGDKVTFSDAVASYFLFQLLVVAFLLPSGETSFLWILAALSALSVPVIGYSLWYQAVEAKIWCRLCLIMDGILTIQAGLFGYLYYEGMEGTGYPRIISIAAVLLLFGTVGSAVLLLKHKIKVAGRSEQAEIAANRIKNSPEVFMYLFRQEKRIDTTPFEQELLIGNPNAPIKILMAASLGCGPCKEGFEEAMQLIETYPDKVHVALRFRDSGSGEYGISSASTYLIEYWRQYIHGKADGSARCEQLIRDWYSEPNIKSFKQQYPMKENNSLNGATNLAEKHYTWTEQAGIKATPTFLINDFKLPRQYRVEDLAAMIPSLAEEFIHKSAQQNIGATNKEIILAYDRNSQG